MRLLARLAATRQMCVRHVPRRCRAYERAGRIRDSAAREEAIAPGQRVPPKEAAAQGRCRDE